MIYLITGVPGASKTLNAIKFVNEDATFKDRQVFYHNIKELTLDWEKLETDEEAKNWQDLPDGSVVILDECQGIFPQRGAKGQVPDYISALNTHRHRGFDFVIVTQHPRLIDVAVRRLVGRHFHFERAFGFNRARKLDWQECIDDPKDYHHRQLAITDTKKFDSKYYGVYKSAETHTHKAKIPAKLYMLGVLILAFLAGSYHFYTRMTDRFQPEEVVNSALETGSDMIPINLEYGGGNFEPLYPLDPNDYLDLYKPRIAGLAHTAPIYDELTKPQRAPKTICIRVHRNTGSQCSCYTEQGTALSVPLNRCENIVDNGLYDPTIPPAGSGIRRADNSRGVPSGYSSESFAANDRETSLERRIQPLNLPPLKASL